MSQYLLSDSCNFRFINNSFTYESFCILLGQGFGFSDLLIHLWLREARFIDFIMPVLTIANHINENILPKGLPVRHHEFADSNQALRSGAAISCINANHGNSKALHDVGAVIEASAIDRVGGEPYLVVGDNVDRTSDVKLWQLAQRQRLVGCTLSTESCIAMSLNIQDGPRISTLSIIDLRFGLAHGYRILGLKMAWVVHHRQGDLLVRALE
jgi:hypothetical protein